MNPKEMTGLQLLQAMCNGRIPAPEPYRVCRRPNFLRECPDEKSKIYP